MKNPGQMKARRFAIASCTHFATEAGVQIANIGANAIDVGVAIALDLIVTNPLMCGIGGGGFATIRQANGDIYTVDFFNAMPGKGLPEDTFLKQPKPNMVFLPYGVGIYAAVGHSSVSVPGTIKGLECVLQQFGTLTFKDIIFPAVRHAKEGIPLNKTVAYWLDISSEKIHWYTDYAKQILSRTNGEKLRAGDMIKQEDLAQTLEAIAQYGSDVIYKGDIADLITEEILHHGGFVTKQDLASYEAIIRKPAELTYKNCFVATNPPPSAGGPTLIKMLKVSEYLDMQNKYNSDMVFTLGKLIKESLEERYCKYKDADYNQKQFEELNLDETILKQVKQITKSPDTTHLSVVDDLGNAIAITMSLGYGSGVGIKGTGIIFDNVLGETEMNPLGFYALKPGARFVSNMSPTILVNQQNGSITALGTPGASRIPSCLFHVITNMVDLGVDLKTAVSMPRFHYEDNKFAVETGIQIDAVDPRWEVIQFNSINMYFGGAQCVEVHKDNTFSAVSDPRRSGACRIID